MMHLGLNKNRFWFLNFKEAPSIWDSLFKFCCVSVQTFSEILRISEKVWHLSPRFSEIYLNCQLLLDTLMLLKNILGEPRTVANPSPRTGEWRMYWKFVFPVYTKTRDLYFQYILTIFLIINTIILITYLMIVMWLFIVTFTLYEPMGLFSVEQ